MIGVGIQILVWLAFTLPDSATNSDVSISGHEPRACVGFSPTHKAWGWQWMFREDADAICAPGSAVFDIDNPSTTRRHWFNCCPLPADDILEDVHVWADAMCPSGYVVTGLKAAATGSAWRALRCSKVNAQRYRLAPRAPGISWGLGTSFIVRMEPHKLRKTEIPDVIASSFGRKGLGVWDGNGCTGQPIGSLFVGSTGNACPTALFQQLLFKGVDSDPPESYPVQMFPRCIRLLDIFNPSPICSDGALALRLPRRAVTATNR